MFDALRLSVEVLAEALAEVLPEVLADVAAEVVVAVEAVARQEEDQVGDSRSRGFNTN